MPLPLSVAGTPSRTRAPSSTSPRDSEHRQTLRALRVGPERRRLHRLGARSRGHGDNPTPPVGHGHFADAAGWRAVLDDTWAVSSALQSAYPALPLLLFAHSMGSFIGQTLIGEHGEAYAGVVLAGSNGPPRALEHMVRALARTQRLMLGGRAPGRWVHRVVMGTYNKPFAPNRTPADWLSRDDAEVDRHVADPLCGFVNRAGRGSTSWTASASSATMATCGASRSRCPST